MIKRTSLEIVGSVTFALILREVRGRFGRVRMGAFWTVAEPLLHILAFTIFVTALRGATVNGIEFPVYLFCALAPFLLFRNIVFSLMESLEANKGLFSYKQILPLDTFVSRAVVETTIFALVYCLISIGFLWLGYDVTIDNPIEWLATLATALTFSFSLGVAFAMVVQVLPEAKVFFRLIFLPLYILSGILFSPASLSAEVQSLLLINPYLHITELLRAEVFSSYRPMSGVSMHYIFVVAVASLCISLAIYRLRREHLRAI